MIWQTACFLDNRVKLFYTFSRYLLNPLKKPSIMAKKNGKKQVERKTLFTCKYPVCFSKSTKQNVIFWKCPILIEFYELGVL